MLPTGSPTLTGTRAGTDKTAFPHRTTSTKEEGTEARATTSRVCTNSKVDSHKTVRCETEADFNNSVSTVNRTLWRTDHTHKDRECTQFLPRTWCRLTPKRECSLSLTTSFSSPTDPRLRTTLAPSRAGTQPSTSPPCPTATSTVSPKLYNNKSLFGFLVFCVVVFLLNSVSCFYYVILVFWAALGDGRNFIVFYNYRPHSTFSFPITYCINYCQVV